MAVLNAFQLAIINRDVARTAIPETVAQARKRAVDAAKKPQRVVRVVDTAGRSIPFDRPKGQEIVLEGSVSGQQSTAKRAAMRKARI